MDLDNCSEGRGEVEGRRLKKEKEEKRFEN
jgi:hypothetical protein